MKPLRALMAVLSAVLLAVPGAQAQKLKTRMADRYAEVFDYPNMAVIYADIVQSGKATADDYRKLAFAYRRTGRLDLAAATYSQLLTMGTPSVQDMRDNADVLRELGRYSDAMVWYKRIAQEVPGDAIAQAYAEDPNVFQRLKRDSTRNQVRNLPINSAEADLGVAIMDDLLLFSSARGEGVGGKTLYKWDDEPFLNLYTALLKGETATDPMVMRKDVNSRYHDGTASYDSTNHRLYFTRDNYFYGTLNKAKDGQLKLGIFFSDVQPGEFGQKEWSGLAEFEHNDPEYNTGHPSVAPGGRRLYFVSDRPGGLGGTDIWYCEALGRQWGAPVNLGAPVNTAGNEMYPFISSDSVLYFTSNGHPGLGGYDLFSSRLTPAGPGKVTNLGYPVNTTSNDIGIVLLKGDTAGFFVSDRPGGKGSDDIYGCTIHPPATRMFVRVIEKGTGLPVGEVALDLRDDAGRFVDDAKVETMDPGKFTITAPYRSGYVISAARNGYKQNIVEVDPMKDDLDNIVIELEKYDYAAEGTVMHGETLAPIAGAKVQLCSATDEVLEEAVTGADGRYAFALKPETDYRLKVDKEGFFKQSARITTKGRTSTVIRTDFKLFPLEVDQVVRLDNIYYDVAKWNIRPDAALELDKLVQTLQDNPSVKIELSSHTDCRGKDAYNMTLSEKRAKSAVEYVVKHGIAKDRIVSKGYGETKPVETCECTKCTEDQHQRNRRTEFKVLSK
ncbi:MAG: OmpA family protein [Flavobacteriales bacterium]